MEQSDSSNAATDAATVVAAATVNTDAVSAAALPLINAAPVATPENTSVPGGGRWAWSDTLPGWVEVPEPVSF